MNSFLEMEWGNAKWDWENLVMYGSKVGESSKKLQLTDWDIEEEGAIDVGSLNLSGGGGGGGGGGGSGSGQSGSELGNGSSGKSSISASTDSSAKDGMKTSSFSFEALKGSFGDTSMKTASGRVELSGTPPPLEGSVGSTEPLIGLKLGKRTYFENSCSGGGNAKSPSSVISVPSTAAAKKTKSLSPSASIPCCQVEGCNLDLSSAKEYHRKHRVCDSHSKSTTVIVGGQERRFCQQCSRFHSLSEFDEKKRSCRRRLSDHNARRRKPQQETIHFNSPRLPSSFYDCRQQMNFVLNDAPLVHTRNAANSEWESTYCPKFTITREFPSKPEKAGGMPGQPQMMGHQLPHAISTHSNTSNGFLGLKGGTSQVFSQGFKESIFSSTVDATPEFRRALSLLSTNSCGSYKPEPISPDNPVHIIHSITPQTVMHAIPQAPPLASAEYWPTGQQSTYPRTNTLPSNTDDNGHLEGIQVFRTPYEEDFYQDPLN